MRLEFSARRRNQEIKFGVVQRLVRAWPEGAEIEPDVRRFTANPPECVGHQDRDHVVTGSNLQVTGRGGGVESRSGFQCPPDLQQDVAHRLDQRVP